MLRTARDCSSSHKWLSFSARHADLCRNIDSTFFRGALLKMCRLDSCFVLVCKMYKLCWNAACFQQTWLTALCVLTPMTGAPGPERGL